MNKNILFTLIFLVITGSVLMYKQSPDITNPESSQEKTHYTSLWDAIMNGTYEEVEALIATGIDVNEYESESALHAAALKGDLNIATLLLKHGADVHAKNYEAGWTPLHEAAAHGHLEIVKLLVAHGADIQTETQPLNDNMYNAFETPLHVACRSGQLEIVQFLVEQSAAIPADESYPYLYNAVTSGNHEIVAYLLDHTGNCKDREQGQPLLVAACFQEQVEIVKLLVAHGFNVNVQDANGQTPLMAAVQCNHTDQVQFLLEHNADTTQVDTLGYNALFYAQEENNKEIADLLMAKGAIVIHNEVTL